MFVKPLPASSNKDNDANREKFPPIIQNQHTLPILNVPISTTPPKILSGARDKRAQFARIR